MFFLYILRSLNKLGSDPEAVSRTASAVRGCDDAQSVQDHQGVSLMQSRAALCSVSCCPSTCNKSFRCSARMPDRPAAPSLRVTVAERRGDRLRSQSDWLHTARAKVRGSGVRRSGSERARKVAVSPSTSSAIVPTGHARVSSPMRTFAIARFRLPLSASTAGWASVEGGCPSPAAQPEGE